CPLVTARHEHDLPPLCLAALKRGWRGAATADRGYGCQPAPDRPIWQWPLPPGGPGGRVVTVMAPPEMDFMTDAVAHWAAVRPDAEALTYGRVRWTWGQWHDRIRRVAGGLAALGLGRGDRVAFLDKNNPACLEVALGAGLLGAATAVINWRLAAG